jgi:hypothetical protein
MRDATDAAQQMSGDGIVALREAAHAVIARHLGVIPPSLSHALR